MVSLGKIYLAGHRGMVGSAIARELNRIQHSYWVGASRDQLDLTDRSSVFKFVENQSPDTIIIAAAKVGGIYANANFPVDFLSQNLQIQVNLIDAAHAMNVPNLIFLGSSCIYPKNCPQPIKEEYLLTGPLEPTNEPYAISKISGVRLIQAYRKQFGKKWISAMPTNLYGPNDNFDTLTSHVLPAMIRKFHDGKKAETESITLWGSGRPMREFLHVDDLARAVLYLLQNYDGDIPINVGTSTDVTIKELSTKVKEIVGYQGKIIWDSSKPDGTPRKLLDTSLISDLGWRPNISLDEGISNTYKWFLSSITES